MQIPKIIHLSVGRKGWSTTGSFVGFVSNMERATSGLDVHFLEWREDRCLWLDMPNIGMYIILIRMQFSVGI